MKTKNIRQYVSSRWFLAIACVILGAIVVLGVRFITYAPPEATHYHANFAVYIDGKRQVFKDAKYYEEGAASACAVEPTAKDENPMDRVHMHSPVNDVVHVEDVIVTWGNFFSVLGWSVGNDYLATDSGVYGSSSQKMLTVMLNGQKVDSLANRIIGDQDTLLVSYGSQSMAQIQKQYDGIKNNAKEANNSDDPASCGGDTDATFRDRFMHMI